MPTGIANIYVARFFFEAYTALTHAVGHDVENLKDCAGQFTGNVLALCQKARQTEEDWVHFKVFIALGVTFAFVIAQAFYLAKHMPDEDDTATEES